MVKIPSRPADYFEWDELLRGGERPEDLSNGVVQRMITLGLMLDEVRSMLGRPLVVTSGYRAPDHPLEARKLHGPGAHSFGCAADLRIRSTKEAFYVIRRSRFTGFGLKMHGPREGRFLHVDFWEGRETSPRPGIWSY